MQPSAPGLVWRLFGWFLVPLYYPEYRNLLIRSHWLSVRLGLLSMFVVVLPAFATPGLLRLVRAWLDRLRADVAEFGRLVRMPRTRLPAPIAQCTPQAGNERELQNPWT